MEPKKFEHGWWAELRTMSGVARWVLVHPDDDVEVYLYDDGMIVEWGIDGRCPYIPMDALLWLAARHDNPLPAVAQA